MEHQLEEPGQAPSQTGDAVAAGEAPLSLVPGTPLRAADVLRLQRAAGNRAVARLLPRAGAARIQRRTAVPERSDKTRTFTYSLKLYTIDAESFEQAKEAADRLNAFTGTVFDEQTQSDFTVRFHVGVYAPPEPDILERAFGLDLHYRTGRRRLRPDLYREAAQRWWLRFLKEEGNTGNLYLGDRPPSEETKDFIREQAAGAAQDAREPIVAEFRRRLDEAKRKGSASAIEDARQYYRKEIGKLTEADPEGVVQDRLDTPHPMSRGTTFAHSVVQMHAPRGPAEYRQNVRMHELMHLLGLSVDHRDLRQSLMSYPYVNAHKTELVMPQQQDLEQLVYADNPPATASVD